MVKIKTDVGIFWGKWCSDDVVFCNRHYFVELDYSETLDLNRINIVESNKFCIESQKDTLFLYGYVEKIEEDVLFLRIGVDIIMFIITPNLMWNVFVHQFVCISIDEVSLFDIGL